MRVYVWCVVTTLALAVLATGEASAAKKKTPAQKQIIKAYDRNHDGKLGRYEKAAAMPAIAAMREQRALRRNAAVLQGIQ